MLAEIGGWETYHCTTDVVGIKFTEFIYILHISALVFPPRVLVSAVRITQAPSNRPFGGRKLRICALMIMKSTNSGAFAEHVFGFPKVVA